MRGDNDAEHHGGAAALAADQFGDGVNFVGRKRDDGGAPRQPGELLLAGESKLRQTRPADDTGAGEQPFDDRLHGRGAEHQRFLAAAPVQHAIGEDVAALEIGGELDFIDGEKCDIEIARHRLDGGDPNRGLGGLIFSSPVTSATASAPTRSTAFVVDLARQKPQRQADQARRMRQHALDGEMGFPGIGRTENGRDACATGAMITVGRRRE